MHCTRTPPKGKPFTPWPSGTCVFIWTVFPEGAVKALVLTDLSVSISSGQRRCLAPFGPAQAAGLSVVLAEWFLPPPSLTEALPSQGGMIDELARRSSAKGARGLLWACRLAGAGARAPLASPPFRSRLSPRPDSSRGAKNWNLLLLNVRPSDGKFLFPNSQFDSKVFSML